jgi:hypothetical protein
LGISKIQWREIRMKVRKLSRQMDHLEDEDEKEEENNE